MAEAPVRKRRRIDRTNDDLAGFAKYDLEADYQKRSRKTKVNDRHQKLPVKNAAGVIVEQENTTRDVEISEESDIEENGSDAVDSVHEQIVAPKLSHQQEVLQAKETLARVAASISENPEENIGALSALKELANSSNNTTVKQLALVTQSAVFKDIIPGYRIRPLARDDLDGKVSKDVKKLRTFEQGLLSGYTEYVKELSKLVKTCGSNDAQLASLGRVALICVCTLLDEAPHFNLRNDLIATVVSLFARSKSVPPADFDRAIEAFERLFQNDEDGHVSLEAVTQMTKMMQKRDYHFNERVLNTFLHLRLLSEFRGKASTQSIQGPDQDDEPAKQVKKQKREFRTKRERKVLRERKAIEHEMKEADAAVSHEERDQNQAQTLKQVFIAYFRILKARVPSLTGAVLEGLARYAHLINQDFFGDLLEVLRELIKESGVDDTEDAEADEESSRNVTRQVLLCITTAFAMLQGQVEVTKSATALHLDLNHFVTQLYRQLLPLGMDPDIELSSKTTHLQDPNGLRTPSESTKVNVATTTVLLLRSLSAALLPPINMRSVPPARINAFVKLLLTATLHLPPKSATAMIGLINQIAKVHGNKIAALWNTEERRGDGVYNALSDDVEAANPYATTIWEGELLRHHFDPKVKDGILNVERTIKQIVK